MFETLTSSNGLSLSWLHLLLSYALVIRIEFLRLRIHADLWTSGLLYDLLYNLLSRSQCPRRWTLSTGNLGHLSDSYRHLLLGRQRARSVSSKSSIDLYTSLLSLSSLPSLSSSSPAEELLDQAYHDRHSNRSEEGHIDCKFMFVGLQSAYARDGLAAAHEVKQSHHRRVEERFVG
jgi:hypothetical protein